MAILGRMDKVAAAVALFSVTILEGGSMVLAKIFREEGLTKGIDIGRAEGREEGRAEGIEIGRAESQAEIAELQEQVKRLQSENGKSDE